MKKIILTAIALFMAITMAEAKDLVLKSGTNNWVKDNAKAQIDYSRFSTTKVKGDKQNRTTDEYFMSKDAERELKGDLDNHKPTYIDYWHDCIEGGMDEFCSYFNEHKGKNVAITATTEAEGAKYRLDVHTTQIYLGSVTAGLFRVNRRGGGMQFYGTLDVIEVATGKIVAVYDMEKVKGTAEYTKRKMVKAVSKFLAKRVGELK